MLEISSAVTEEDLYECFKFRKYVFVDKYHYFECNKKVLCDEFDALPNSVIFIAKMNNKIMGTIRFSFCFNKEFDPATKFFCFDAITEGKLCVSGSMFCAVHFGHISELLLIYFFAYAFSQSADFLIACINPAAAKIFKSLGAEEAGPEFTLNEYPQPILPVFINKDHYGEFISSFKHKIDITFSKKKFQVFSESEALNLNLNTEKLSPIIFRSKLQITRNKIQKQTEDNNELFDKFYVSL